MVGREDKFVYESLHVCFMAEKDTQISVNLHFKNDMKRFLSSGKDASEFTVKPKAEEIPPDYKIENFKF